MSVSKQARETYNSRIVGGEVFLSCTRWQCKMFVVLDGSKGIHKWNIKRHYDTVLCSKSAADASNLSIFTLCHVHCGLRCATSSWGHIEYMIADACITLYCSSRDTSILWYAKSKWGRQHRAVLPTYQQESAAAFGHYTWKPALFKYSWYRHNYQGSYRTNAIWILMNRLCSYLLNSFRALKVTVYN